MTRSIGNIGLHGVDSGGLGSCFNLEKRVPRVYGKIMSYMGSRPPKKGNI